MKSYQSFSCINYEAANNYRSRFYKQSTPKTSLKNYRVFSCFSLNKSHRNTIVFFILDVVYYRLCLYKILRQNKNWSPCGESHITSVWRKSWKKQPLATSPTGQIFGWNFSAIAADRRGKMEKCRYFIEKKRWLPAFLSNLAAVARVSWKNDAVIALSKQISAVNRL